MPMLRNTFFFCAVRSWNKLPLPLKTIKSATQFQTKLHTHKAVYNLKQKKNLMFHMSNVIVLMSCIS